MTVTSGTLSPMLDQGIGLAYVDAGLAAPEHEVHRRPARATARCSYRPKADLQTGGVIGCRRVVSGRTPVPPRARLGARSTATRPRSGITWYAQDALGEIVHFEPPAEGASVAADESYGEVESVKAVSDLISPLSGEVVEVNPIVVEEPEKVNDDPYGDGWLIKIRLSDPGEADGLLDVAAYKALLDEQ